jgi:hypothetical protein
MASKDDDPWVRDPHREDIHERLRFRAIDSAGEPSEEALAHLGWSVRKLINMQGPRKALLLPDGTQIYLDKLDPDNPRILIQVPVAPPPSPGEVPHLQGWNELLPIPAIWVVDLKTGNLGWDIDGKIFKDESGKSLCDVQHFSKVKPENDQTSPISSVWMQGNTQYTAKELILDSVSAINAKQIGDPITQEGEEIWVPPTGRLFHPAHTVGDGNIPPPGTWTEHSTTATTTYNWALFQDIAGGGTNYPGDRVLLQSVYYHYAKSYGKGYWEWWPSSETWYFIDKITGIEDTYSGNFLDGKGFACPTRPELFLAEYATACARGVNTYLDDSGNHSVPEAQQDKIFYLWNQDGRWTFYSTAQYPGTAADFSLYPMDFGDGGVYGFPKGASQWKPFYVFSLQRGLGPDVDWLDRAIMYGCIWKGILYKTPWYPLLINIPEFSPGCTIPVVGTASEIIRGCQYEKEEDKTITFYSP